jgi:hypothetical protein
VKPRPSMYSRPDKPLYAAVPSRDWRARTVAPDSLQTPIVVHAGSECHVTPPDVALRMADALGDLSSVDVLEPSAGTGNLARATLAAGCNPDRLTMVEMHTGLAAGLRSIGRVECGDFLDWAQTAPRFGAVVMNPPFSRVKTHVGAAVQLLAPGGVLVALVPITFQHDAFEDLETLSPDTFASAKVHTKIVRYQLGNTPT